MSSPFWTSLPSPPSSHCSGLIQSPCLSSLRHTATRESLCSSQDSTLRRLSLVAMRGGYSVVGVVGFSLQWKAQALGRRLQLLQHVRSAAVAPGLESTGAIAVMHRLRCSVTCGIFPDHGSNPCLLMWQVDSLPLNHQGSPSKYIFKPHYPGDRDGEGRVG